MTTNLMNASRNLMTRPADEHFASFADLLAAAQRDDRNSAVAVTPVDNIQVLAAVDGSLAVASKRSSKVYPMTHHSARAVCKLAGANPDFVFGRLTPKVAAEALTDSLGRTKGEDVALHLGTLTNCEGKNDGAVLRGVTSKTYARVADADWLHEVHEWLLPLGFEPARPTKNTDAQRNNVMGNNKPCLFRGDKDSFAFFMHEAQSEGAGGRPVRSGFIGQNSEVGVSSLWGMRFLFDDLCANFIIWNARDVQTFRAIHRGNPSQIVKRFREELREVAGGVTQKELEIVNAAAALQFATDTTIAVERLLADFNLSEANAQQAVALSTASENRGLRPLTYAAIANGVTSLAKQTGNADKLVEMATIGGDIYLAAV